MAVQSSGWGCSSMHFHFAPGPDAAGKSERLFLREIGRPRIRRTEVRPISNRRAGFQQPLPRFPLRRPGVDLANVLAVQDGFLQGALDDVVGEGRQLHRMTTMPIPPLRSSTHTIRQEVGSSSWLRIATTGVKT